VILRRQISLQKIVNAKEQKADEFIKDPKGFKCGLTYCRSGGLWAV